MELIHIRTPNPSDRQAAKSRNDPLLDQAAVIADARWALVDFRVLCEVSLGQLLDARHVAGSHLVGRGIQAALGLFVHRDVAIVVEALHCERLGASCDIGRPPAALRAAFPDLAFDHLDDPWWYVDGIANAGFEIPANGRGGPIGTTFGLEPMTHLQNRIAAFRDWLKARPEPAIAAVGHATFFAEMTGHMLQNCECLSVEV